MDFVKRSLDVDTVKDARVLEVGSYNVNGSVRPYIESLAPARYLGSDMRSGPGVDYVVDCEQIESISNFPWDIVISAEMLEHAKNWRLCMRRMESVLRPAGLLLLTTRSPGFPLHAYPHDYWRFTVRDMERILDGLNMDAIAIEDDPEQSGVFVLARKTLRLGAVSTLEDIEVQAVKI
jgi:SAM-dependent methyltransferase